MKKKILLVIGLLIVIISGLLVYKYIDNYRHTDAYKFNNEYNVKTDLVKYVPINEVADILKKDQAILYIGSSHDENCQKTMSLFVDTLAKYQFSSFYYLDVTDEEAIYDVIDNKAVKTKDSSEEYKNLLTVLDPLLKENVIRKDGKDYKTGEKKINLPFVLTIKNGEISNYHEQTVNLEKDQLFFDISNNEQRLKLIDIYSDLLCSLNE